jgi:hypothetical protein
MMSDKAQRCFDQYLQNAALAVVMESQLDDDRGWSIVVRFYAALQLINAYLIDKGNLQFRPESTEHKERKAALERSPELRDAPQKYRQLKDLSESVRYHAGFQCTPNHRDSAIAWLRKIVAIVEPKLKKI